MLNPLNMPTGQLLLFLVITAIPILPNLWSIWHAYNRDFPTVNEKAIWMAICVFVPVLGGLAYLIFGRPRAKRPGANG